MTDDNDTILLLHRVDELRAELRRLEPELTKACVEFGKRRGCFLYREHHVRRDTQAAA